MLQVRNFIEGRFVDGAERLPLISPATGASYGELADSSKADVEAAVSAAERAFAAWSQTAAEQRSRVLLAIADGIESELERFAEAEAIDTGKPLNLARTVDIPRAVKNFRFFATAILHQQGEAHFTDRAALNYTLRQPLGVAGLISPWNLPLYLLSWKVAPALAAGCTAVAKPSELTPVTAQLLGEVCQRVGLPDGVLNIVHGRGALAGAALVADPRVPALSFTGGTQTGREIAEVAAPMFKHLALELGGKNPTIIFADADLDQALETAVRASFANQGQICLCGSRLFVERPIYDRFVARFVERTRELVVGDPLDSATEVGALISAAHRDKVQRYVMLAKDSGGRVLCGGMTPRGLSERVKNGFYFLPTVVADLDEFSPVNQEEVFGPLVSVMPFADEEQVVAAANCTPYGLSASVWTQNLARAHRVAGALACGTVWINCWLLRDLRVPFGGTKQSGVGREGGLEALRFFCETKNVCLSTEQA
ncbi:MAG: aldehyde dehydrogenase [Deltaproteobacteria bacterium]|nr:aldehyde dehydrogenase [Deltaproteobacteria bacterium]